MRGGCADDTWHLHGTALAWHHLFGMTFDPAFNLQAVWEERLDPPEQSGGGELTNMGCYAIDCAVALFGRPPAVSAKRGTAVFGCFSGMEPGSGFMIASGARAGERPERNPPPPPASSTANRSRRRKKGGPQL